MQSKRARSGAGVAVVAALCFLVGCGDVKSKDEGSGSEDARGEQDAGSEEDAGNEEDAGSEVDAGSEDAGSIDNGELTIINDSDFLIDEVYVAETGSDYGPNLAPEGGLRPQDAQGIVLACALYDVLLFDEEGIECEVVGLDVCDDEDTLVFENDDCFVVE